MNALSVMLPEPFIRALCWTLVYSLGWGVLAAALTGIALLLTKKMRAVVRYFFLTGILLLFAGTTLFTFYQQLSLAVPLADPFSATVATATGADSPTAPLTVVAGKGSVVDALAFFCNRYSTVIVLTWLLVIALRCIRLVVDLRKVHHLTKRRVVPPGDAWNERLAELSARLRISAPVRLLQSAIVKVPVTLGHLKPIILVPVGILTSIPPDQVEAILLHELAHIRRRDYMVNILQRSIEILFFFNPAVLWISALIKEERENCCDDIVISHTDNRVGYVNALVAFQEYHLAAPMMAPAFAGTKGHLLARVKRILYNTNKTLDGMEKTLLVTGMAIAGFFFFSSLQVRNRVAVRQVVSPAGAGVLTADTGVYGADTLPNVSRSRAAAKNMNSSEPTVIEATVDGKHYKFIEKDNVITELSINGKKVSRDDLAGYQSLTMIAPLLSNARAGNNDQADNLKVQKALLDAQQANLMHNNLMLRKMKAESTWKKLLMDSTQQGLMLQKMNLDKGWRQRKMDTAEWNSANLDLAKIDAELLAQKEIAELQMQKGNTELQSQKIMAELQMQKGNTELQSQKIMAELQMQKGNAGLLSQKEMAEWQRKKENADLLSQKEIAEWQMKKENADLLSQKKNAESLLLEMNRRGDNSLDRYIDPIIDDLIDYKVVGEDDRGSVSFELNEQGLTVNGIRQPQELFAKFKQKYIKNPEDLFRLIVKNKTNRTITVNIH